MSMGKLMIFAKIGRGLAKTFPGTAMFLKTYGPEIATGISIATGVGATIAAGVAGAKVEGVLDDNKNRLEDIRQHHMEMGTIGTKEFNKEVRNAKVDCGKELAKLFLPALILQGVSIGTNISGTHALRKENAAIAASAAAIGRAFDDYRKNVIADQGVEKDKQYAGPTVKEVVEMTEDQAPVVVRREGEPGVNPFGILIDHFSSQWQRDRQAFLVHLYFQEKMIQDHIGASTRKDLVTGETIPGYIFWNDILPYVMNGSEATEMRTPEGQYYGWYDGGEPFEFNVIETIVDDEPAYWLDLRPEKEPITWVFRRTRAERKKAFNEMRKLNKRRFMAGHSYAENMNKA